MTRISWFRFIFEGSKSWWKLGQRLITYRCHRQLSSRSQPQYSRRQANKAMVPARAITACSQLLFGSSWRTRLGLTTLMRFLPMSWCAIIVSPWCEGWALQRHTKHLRIKNKSLLLDYIGTFSWHRNGLWHHATAFSHLSSLGVGHCWFCFAQGWDYFHNPVECYCCILEAAYQPSERLTFLLNLVLQDAFFDLCQCWSDWCWHIVLTYCGLNSLPVD